MKKTAVILCLLSVAAVAACAQSLDFTLVNSTGHAITAVYLSTAGDDDWGDNVLDLGPLPNKGSRDVILDPAYEAELLALGADSYDVKVVLDGKTTVVYPELSLGDITTVEVSVDITGSGTAKAM